MLSYQNPVYNGSFADPFVWHHGGRYYAVGTGPLEGSISPPSGGAEDRAFPLLISDDFVHWHYHGGALLVPENLRGGEFWAPEVAWDGKSFFLYYSVATEGLNHKLHVASSNDPAGPYQDLGLLMVNADAVAFAIDAHPIQDDDGTWYLFYARDFLDSDKTVRAGTALVVDRLVEMTRLAGEEKVVLRASCDWQLFQARRTMYGREFDWHTLEGPFVRKHEGIYYCFYSGGCFENESYGVDFARAAHILGPYDASGGEEGARVLKTVAGRVIGPGHQSIVKGPDGKTDFIVYHAWSPDMSSRKMCLDPLAWTSDGPRCLGPSWTRQMIGA